MSKLFISLSASLFIIIQCASAQDSLRINLTTAIDIALSDNPTIKIANQEIERQRYVRNETKGALMPAVSASGTYNYNIMNPVMFMPDGVFGPGSGGPIRMGYSNSVSGGVSVSVPLFMPTIYRTLELNDEQMREAVEMAQSSKIELVNLVKKNLYAILLGENSLNVIKDNIYFAEIVVENSRNAYKQGIVSEYDLITAEVQLSNLNPALQQAENAIRVSRLMMNMLLSLPLNTPIAFDEHLHDFKDFIDNKPTNILDLTNNSELNILDIQKNILEKQLKLQKATRIPTLSAIAQYQVLSQSNNLRVAHYQWRGTALAGLQLSIPLFSGLSRVNKEFQIKNTISQLYLQREYAEQNLTVSAQTALSNIRKAREQMNSNIATKAQAQKGYRISKTRYDTGAGTIVELNTAQMAMLQADLNLSQSIYDYMIAQADFEKIMGKVK